MLEQKVPTLNAIAFYFFLSLTLYILSPTTGHAFDTSCWNDWSKYIFENGLQNVYNSNTDYLPLYHYVLFIFGELQGGLREISSHIYRLKAVTLIFEACSSYLLFRILEERFKDYYKALLFSLVYFCNVAVLYNSLIWGQVDGIFTFFVFASVAAAYYKRFFFSCICFLIAINLKLQAIIFIPLLLLLIAPAIKKSGLKKTLFSISAVVILQILILLPFLINDHFNEVMKVVTGSVGKYPYVSLNAYNMWYILIDGELRTMEDSIKFAGLTYTRWGQIMFFLTGFAALYHLIKPNYLLLFKKEDFRISERKVFITAALIPLLFFFLNTQMHERYSHPAFIFITAYCLLYKKPVLLLLGSMAYFLNLEDVYRYLNSGNYNTLIFSSTFIATLYAICIMWLFYELYDMKIWVKQVLLVNKVGL